MLSEAFSSLEVASKEALERSANYEWMAAAETWKLALEDHRSQLSLEESTRLTELLAGCYFKAAFQSSTPNEFNLRMQAAEQTYNGLSSLYDSTGFPGKAKKARAKSLFATFWLKPGAKEKNSTINECISLAEDSAQLFSSKGDIKNLADTHRDILSYGFETFFLSEDKISVQKTFTDGVETGEKAIREFRELNDDEGLIDSLNTTVRFLTWVAFWAADPRRYRESTERAGVLAAEAVKIAERIGKPHALSVAKEASGFAAHFIGERLKGLELIRESLASADAVKDSYLIGRLKITAAINGLWVTFYGEDEAQRKEGWLKAAEFASGAADAFRILSDSPLISFALTWEAECYNNLGYFAESDFEKKRAFLRRSIEVSRDAMAISKDFPFWDSSHSLSKALYYLSTIEKDNAMRAQLLAEALPLRQETVRREEAQSPDSWDLGVMYNYLALIKAGLARIEEDPRTKIELLESAARDMELCVESCSKWTATVADAITGLATFQEWYGDILAQLCLLKPEPEISNRTVKVYNDTMAYLEKAGQHISAATIGWKMAKVYNTLSDFKEASQAFSRAAEDYKRGSLKFPRLSSLFLELGSYMDAWSLIEEARIHHNEEQYLQASDIYKKAAATLQQAGKWAPLSTHYSACALLEEGEANSRGEKFDSAKRSFSAAATAFQDARFSIEKNLTAKLGSTDKELEELTALTEARERYANGRLDLEEAKILDRRGDEEASANKYRSAAQTFKKLLYQSNNPQGPSELRTLSLFCEAWTEMKEAELKVSPEDYASAAKAFNSAKAASTRQKYQLLAQANASICLALEAGSRFRLTQDVQLYGDIKKQMQTAADCYRHAGFENDAEWTNATQRLFDALVYLADAEVERDSKKRAELYHLSEKHLELAAKLYDQAGYSSKRDDMLKQLKRVRDEKEILLTPIEALAENPALSRTSAPPASLVRDQALGLERFETASVVGNLSLPQKELGVGSELTIELEMANLGKTSATLLKLENLTTNGLELERDKIPYRIEDSFIDMKGKRLDYLKTHELKISLRATRKGTFELRPRILFADEKGTYRSYEFEPAAVTVRELGISGWLKGPK